jgi:hypothetical protein
MSGWGVGGLVVVTLVLATWSHAYAAGPEVRLRAGAGGRSDIFDSSRAVVRDVGPVVAAQLGVRLDDRFVFGASVHGGLGLPRSLERPEMHPGEVSFSYGVGVYVGARRRWTTSLFGVLLPGIEVGFGGRQVSVGLADMFGEYVDAAWLMSASLTLHVDRPFSPRTGGGYGVWIAGLQDLTNGVVTQRWCDTNEFGTERCDAGERYLVGGYGFTAGFEVSFGARQPGRN